MDTMQAELIFKKGTEFTRKEEERIGKTLDRLESPFGFSYCDVLKSGVIYGRDETKIIVKLSFPRFYFENNAHLITTYAECAKVQKHFVKQLKEDKLLSKIKAIRVTRVDIPFTYLIEEGKNFYDYTNVFKVLALAFTKTYKEIEVKSIVDTLKKREQTIIYADTPTISAYNKKITIYNQMKNLDSKNTELIDMERTLEKYPDLPRRMRIEMSKRIKRKEMTLKEFGEYELFKEYLEKYKRELKKLLFDEELLDIVYEEGVENLSEIFEKEKEYRGNSFTYKKFVSDYKEDIYDYKFLKGAVENVISKQKTRESAITEIRKELNIQEERKGLIVIGVRKIIEDIAKTVKKSFKGQRKKKAKKDEWDNLGEFPF
ncbi:hypothetical protein [Candidatus Cetobacterium colombiensis]|uniref:Uncharacterized protein n=1 Tax=Candidatus Cetobacterium colombiensis TaxID=3073100 RepID=A0ABU4W7U1_9FUSO|nr:hypothetical protein [Candidatus Cetobacterium colombiensis]MDX8335107.1 hypothetical protein [Candidatus Cetobacterium colombiensis]